MTSNIIITGTGGVNSLGHIIAQTLWDAGHVVMGLTLEAHTPEQKDYPEEDCDVRSLPSLQEIVADLPPCDVLINCAGVNRIGYLEDFNEDDWDNVMDTNARSIFYTAKAFLPLLQRSHGTILNIVSSASHVPMTGSLAYNASKAAAHMMTLQLARELTKRHGITVFGISPNKLEGTGMSLDIDQRVVETRGWTPEFAKQYQLNSLLTGKETNAHCVADFIAYLLQCKANHEFLSGTVLPYGA